MGKGKARVKAGVSRVKTRPPQTAKGVEATPGVMNGQGLSLELTPIQVIVLRDFWDQAIPRAALESFIEVPVSKSCRCMSGRWE